MIFSSLFLYCYYFFHFQFSFFFLYFSSIFSFPFFFLFVSPIFSFFFMYIFSYLFAVPYSKLLILMERSFFGLRLQFDASAFLIWNPLSTRPSEMLEMPLLFKSRGKENIYSFLHHLCLPQWRHLRMGGACLEGKYERIPFSHIFSFKFHIKGKFWAGSAILFFILEYRFY